MKKFILLSVVVSVFFVLGISSIAHATDPFGEVCNMGTSDNSVCQSKNTTNNPLLGADGILTKVIQLMVMIAGIASVIMIMVGGFKYITSTGDSGKVSSAKDTVLYACIGLVITIFAQAIVSFVLRRL